MSHIPTRRRLVLGAAVTVLALGAGGLISPAAQAADPLEINLVTVNDFHGRIEAASPAGGIAALATAVEQIRATNERTVFAAAGDMIGASTFTSFIQQDVPTIETLNAAGLEVSAAGNHEFDKGWDDLKNRVQDLADWEYIAANVYERSTGLPALAESWVKDFGDVKVGFIGAVTEELPSLVSPAGIVDLEVRDIVDSVNAVADTLTDGEAGNGEADVLVLLIHEGAADTTYATATNPATAFGHIVTNASPKINAIVSGHTHLAYNHEVPYAGGDGMRPVISSGQYGERFSNMVIQFDPETRQVLSMDNTVYPMYTSGVANYPPVAGDPLVDPIVAAVTAATLEASVLGSVKLGDITADFNRARLATGTENRGGESTLGNFVADAQLWAAQQNEEGVQIAFMNPGGLRADMVFAPDGVLTYKEAADVQSFANTLVTLSMTGAQIKAALEQQVQPAGAQRPYLKLGVSKGLEYVFNPVAVPGQQITSVTLDGVAIDPAATYRVVANSFLASGGDNFSAIGQGTDKRDTGKVDLESMVDYMAFLGTATPDPAQRSIGAVLSSPAAQGYEVGSTIDIALSSLDFSTTEPRVTSVDVAIGGIPVGSAPVAPELPTVISDVSGRATVSVTVPEGVADSVPFGTTVTVPLTVSTASGTSIDVPIPVFDRADSAAFGVPSKWFAKKGSAVKVTAIVVAEGGTRPVGEVTVYDGDTAIATATLTAKDRGIVKITLPALDRGVHRLSVSYGGSDSVQPSEGREIPIYIW